MERMNNVVISNAEEGKSGVSKWGPWKAWSVYFVGMKPKFDYFEKDNIVPFIGMQLNLVEYEVRVEGGYTNYKIKSMVPVKLTGLSPETVPTVMAMSNPTPCPSPVSPVASKFELDKRLTMCTSYAKDLMVQIMVNGGYPEKSFSAIIDLVAKGGRRLAEKIVEAPKPEEPVAVEAVNGLEKPVTIPPKSLEVLPTPEVPITPDMVATANKALSSSTSDALGMPGVVAKDDDVPF